MNQVDADLAKLIGVEKMLRFQRVHLMQIEQKRFVSAHQFIFEAAQNKKVCDFFDKRTFIRTLSLHHNPPLN